ncbi:MAG: flagellar basal body P-ring formation chaperone FlgA [Burkholderiaceae bacterium]
MDKPFARAFARLPRALPSDSITAWVVARAARGARRMRSCLALSLAQPARSLLPALMLAAPFALAQPAPASTELNGGIEQQVRELALGGAQARTEPGAQAGEPDRPRVEVVIGALDPRLHLAPCQHVQPYLPEGMRMWGRTRVGVRCLEGPTKWNIYLPVTVKVFGRALVATGALSVGSVLTPRDLTQAEVDLAEDGSPAVVDADFAVGRALARTLKAGESLRQSQLIPRQWFSAGDTVTVLAQGPGFSVASEGRALTNGYEGQPARVRTESGRVLTGQPVAERRLELAL